MNITASELFAIANEYLPQLKTMDEAQSPIKPLPNKWGKRKLLVIRLIQHRIISGN